MSVKIRECRPSDRDRLVDLFQQLNVYEDGVAGDRRTDRSAAEDSLVIVDDRLAERGGVFLVAEVAGEVAGLMVLVYETDSIYIRAERRRYAYIQDLVVDAKQRRHGIGRALMDAAEAAAKAAGHRRIVLGVLAANAAALAAYARQGYRPYAHDLEKIIAPDES
jgi:ribosomal protein S18 acetylase RimI-like enzyme